MKQYLKIAACCAALAAAASVSASAAVALNDYLSIDGYVVGTGSITDVKHGQNDYSLFDSGLENMDSVKFGIAGKYQDFEAYVSALYVQDADSKVGVLDAYVAWSKNEYKVTVGKFLSSLGYEAFSPLDMAQISYSLVAGMPGYHTGAKLDYTGEKIALGFAVVDSLQAGNGFHQGDGDFSDLGFEAYVSYTGVEKLNVFFGVGYDMGNNDTDESSQWIVDLWATYDLSDKLMVAAEVGYAEHLADFSWLVLAQYSFTDDISLAGRISGVNAAAGESDGYKYTISPTYKLNEYVSFRGEISYTNWKHDNDEYFYAIQAQLQF